MIFQPKTKEELLDAIYGYYYYNINDSIKEYGVMNSWDVSLITDMSNLFSDVSDFNEYINDWNVSNVTNMEYMFSGCHSFNQPLDNWNM